MPRMPEADDLPVVEGRSRSIPTPAKDYIGPALERMGQTLQRSAEADANLDMRIKSKEKDENNALDLGAARADWTRGRLEEDEKYDQETNPNYGNWEKSYTANIEKRRQAAAARIRDPKLRQKFLSETEDDVVRGTFAVRDRAKTIDRSKRLGEALDGVESALEAAARPGVDKAESDKLIAGARATIDNLAITGLISPEKAIELRKNFAKQYASLKINQDIQADPEAAYRNLHGDPGEIYYSKLKRKESVARGDAKNPNSSAQGYYQFTDGTWLGVMRAHPELGLTKDGRGNLDQEERAIRAFTSDNAAILRRAGAPVTEASLYLAHFMGASGAVRMYRSDPNTVAATIFPDAAKANPTIFYGPNGPRTVGEVIALQTKGFRGDGGAPAPEYYSVLDQNERVRFETAAQGEYASRIKADQESKALERYQIKSQIDDDLAQIQETGKPSDLDPADVARVMGNDDAAKWLDDRKAAINTFEAVASMDSMTNDEIEQHLEDLEPKATGPGFKDRQTTYDKAERRAKELLDLRIKDPAKAVDDSPIVKAVKAEMKPDDPLGPQRMVKARLAAQEAVDIPVALRQPITRSEARTIIAPIQHVLDMMDATIVAAAGKATDSASRRAAIKEARAVADQQLRQTLDEIEAVYGPYAPQVLAFAIAESVRDKEIGDLASGILRKIRRGEQPTVNELQNLEHTNEASVAEKAVNGDLQKPKAEPPPERKPVSGPAPGGRGNIWKDKNKPKAVQGVWPRPDSRAIDRLRANPNEKPTFEQIFGPGSAVQYLQE